MFVREKQVKPGAVALMHTLQRLDEQRQDHRQSDAKNGHSRFKNARRVEQQHG